MPTDSTTPAVKPHIRPASYLSPPDLHRLTPAEIHSFGFLHNPSPPPATLTVDLRECLYNPHVDPALRRLTGWDAAVRKAVLGTRGALGLISRLTALVVSLLELDVPVVLAIGCAGGRHRAVAVAEEIAARLGQQGWPVELYHRDVHRPVVRRSAGGTSEGVFVAAECDPAGSSSRGSES